MLFATWHIYHYLTIEVSRGTRSAPAKLAQMFHVEQRNRLLTIFNKEIFENIWNITKKVVSLQC